MANLTRNRGIPSLLWCGVSLALFGSISGCRLGNQVVHKPNPDQISGYYVTHPEELTFYVTTADTAHKTAAVSHVPAQVSQYMTNPLMFIIQDLATGKAMMTSPTGTHALPIYIDPDNTLSFSGSTKPHTFWLDPACQEHLELSELGRLSKNVSVTAPDGNKLPISGGIQVEIQAVTLFTGNCTATFQSISDCYGDVTQCGGSDASENLDLQNFAKSLFKDYIDAGVITAADIPHIVNYAYDVKYNF